MNQELSYRLDFAFSGDRQDRDQLLSTIDLFLRSLEGIDRLLAGTLGLELDYRRSLRDMGSDSFRYAVALTLHWPRQILLGSWPDREALRNWMSEAREAAVEAALGEGSGADGTLSRRWHDLATAAGLGGSVMYVPLSQGRLGPLLDDLRRAAAVLGGRDAVRLS